MLEETVIHLKAYDSATRCYEPTGETITTYQIAQALTIENFTELLDEYLNRGAKGLLAGEAVGKRLCRTHRTLQRLAVCFALGLIVGLSEQEYTDPRNETAIATAKKLAALLEAGELPLGLHI